MAWSYSGDPSGSELDQVRFLIGDTDETDPLLQDGEINYLIASKGVNGAAQDACLAIIAKFAREVDYTIGPESVKASKRLEHYRGVLKDIKDSLLGTYAAPVMANTVANSDNPIFDIGMDDNKGGTSWIGKLESD